MTLLLPRRGFAQLLMAGLLLLGAAAALPACDSDDSSDVRFSVQVQTGNQRLTRGGRLALFSARGDSAFTLDLQAPERSGLREGLLLGRGEGGLPRAGRHRFAFPDGRSFPESERFVGALEISFGGAAPTLYYAERGGRLTITERSEGRVSGTFDFRAQRIEAGGTVDAPLSVRVVGRFTAQPGRTDDFPFTDAP